MGIIDRDGQAFSLRGEGGGCPRRSGGGRPPTMVGRPCTGDLRTGTQTPYTTTPRGASLGKFGSPGMTGTDNVRAPPRRDATNLNPPPLRTPFPLGGNP